MPTGDAVTDGDFGDPEGREANAAEIICFTGGTLIATPRGERPIETLRAGDEVLTLDRGPQVLRWIGRRTVRATGRLAPILFARGTIGNHRDLLVSPQHRMLCAGAAARRITGRAEVLAPAASLVDDFAVSVAYGGMAPYIHLLFDRHELVIANGAPSESFHAAGAALAALAPRARDDLFRVLPKLRSDAGAYGPRARHCLAMPVARTLARAGLSG